MKRLWVLLLFSLLATAARAQEFTASYPGKGVLDVTGSLRFHTGDDLRWLNPTFDDSSWESLSGEATWGAQTHPGYSGFAWYRRSIDIANVTGPLSIELTIDGVYEVYWDGQRIGGFGRFPPHAAWPVSWTDSVFSLPKPDASGHLKGVLAVRVWLRMPGSQDEINGGGLKSPPSIGDTTLLNLWPKYHAANGERGSLIQIVESAMLIMVALIAIGMWAFDRSRRLLFWLSIFLLGYAGGVASSFPVWYRFAGYNWLQLYLSVIDTARDLGIWMLILVLFGLDRERVWRRTTAVLAILYLLAMAIDTAIQWFWSSGWPALRPIDGITTAIGCVLPAYLLILLLAGLRRRRDLTLLPTVLACAALEFYILIQSALPQGIQFTHFDPQKIAAALTMQVGNYSVGIDDFLQVSVLIVLVATIYREQVRERTRQLFVESELKSAQEIQSVLVPEETPSVPGFAISSLYWPAGEVGGDMFQVIPGDAGDLLIVLADVSGKGLKAAMTVSLLVGAVRTLADTTSDPLAILAALNQRLLGRSRGGFTTGLVLHVSATGLVGMANAGHLPPFLNGEAVALEGSLPLGLIAGTEFPVCHFQLEEGDDLTLYTDGVLEAQRESGELFGFERMAELLGSRPTVQVIAETARGFGQMDDITVVKIVRNTLAESHSHVSVDLQTVAARS